jgi:hypothetical protein
MTPRPWIPACAGMTKLQQIFVPGLAWLTGHNYPAVPDPGMLLPNLYLAGKLVT